MAASVLSKLVGTDKETKESLVSIDKTLQKIYTVQTKQAKEEAKRDKREQQKNKRRRGDKPLDKLLKKEAKTKKKGILGSLLDGLLGPIAGLLASVSIPTLLGALGLGAVGAGLTAYFKSPGFKKFVDDNIFNPIGEFIRTSLQKLTGNKKAKTTGDSVASLVDDAVTEITSGGKRGAARKQLTTNRNDLYRKLNRSEEYGGIPKGTPEYEQAQKDYEDSKRLANMFAQKENMELQYERAVQNSEMKDEEIPWYVIGNKDEYRDRMKKQALKLDKNINDKIIQLKREIQTLDRLGIEDYTQDFQRRQSGGPLTVPGHSTGDKHAAILPPGSFVLNRNAAGYQNGGIPAMLESGEQVYGPGQWGPREMMLNSAVPRFQNGGEVDPTRKPKEGEISTSALGTMIFKNGKWQDHNAYTDISATEKRMRALSPDWGSPAAAPERDTSDEEVPPKSAPDTGTGGLSAVIATGKSLLERGFTVAEHPNFHKQNGYDESGSARVGSHSANSLHNVGLALDVTDWRGGDWLGRTSKLAEEVYKKKEELKLREIIHDPWGSYLGGSKGGAIGGHGTHLHLGFASGPGDGLNGSGDASGGANTGPGGILGSILSLGGPMGDFMKQIMSVIGDAFGESGLMSSIFGGGGGSGGNITPGAGGTGPVDMGADVTEQLTNTAKLAMAAGFSKSEAKTMAAIAGGESSFNNRAHNGNTATGDNSYGLWQINMLGRMGADRRAKLGISSDTDLFDPAINARAAKMIYDSQGFGAWGAYKDGNAAKYMNAAQALKLQTGGVVNMRGSSGGPNISQKSENQFIDKLASAMSPVVVPVPMGGGGGGQASGSHETNRSVPSLSANPNNSVALDLAYRLSVGAAFS